jgi:hypothetical protein
MPFDEQFEFETFNRWLEAIGMPDCQRGTHNRPYHYQDAFEKLGYVMEYNPPYRVQGPMPPQYKFDFSARVED